jgi:hypothetical protein
MKEWNELEIVKLLSESKLAVRRAICALERNEHMTIHGERPAIFALAKKVWESKVWEEHEAESAMRLAMRYRRELARIADQHEQAKREHIPIQLPEPVFSKVRSMMPVRVAEKTQSIARKVGHAVAKKQVQPEPQGFRKGWA